MSQDTKFCTTCGYEVNINTKFCPQCGAAIEETPQAAPAKPQYANTFQPKPVAEQTGSTVSGYAPIGSSGYVARDKSYFNLSTMFNGVGNLITNTWQDALMIFAVFTIVVSAFSYFVTIGIIDAFIPQVPSDIAEILGEDFVITLGFTLVSSILFSLFGPLAQLPFYRRLDNYETGRDESMAESVSYGLRQLLNFIGLIILLFIIRIGYGVVIGGVITAGFLIDASVGLLILLVAGLGGIVLIIYIEMKLYVAIPFVVIEGNSPFEALRNSWRVTQENVLKVFVFALFLGFASGIITGIVGQVTSPIAIALTGDIFVGVAVSVVFQYLVSLPLTTWFAAGAYYFLRYYHGDLSPSKIFNTATNRFQMGEAAGPTVK